MSIVDSKTIDKIYEIPKGDYRNMRKNIREKFASYLKEKGKPEKFPWNSLTKIEQDYEELHRPIQKGKDRQQY